VSPVQRLDTTVHEFPFQFSISVSISISISCFSICLFEIWNFDTELERTHNQSAYSTRIPALHELSFSQESVHTLRNTNECYVQLQLVFKPGCSSTLSYQVSLGLATVGAWLTVAGQMFVGRSVSGQYRQVSVAWSSKAVPWCYYVSTLQTGTETDALIHFKM